MSKGVKVFLIVLGICIAGMLVVFGVGAWWVYRNADDLKDGLAKIEAEAVAFAAGTDQDGCMAEATRRAGECGVVGPMCEAKAGIFLRLCLGEATPVAGFCDGVPARDAFIETTQWALDECGTNDAVSNNRCTRLMQAKQRYCSDAG